MRRVGKFLVLAACLGMSLPCLAARRKILLGFSATWFDGGTPPQAYPYGDLDYIARAFLTPKADGEIAVPGGYFDPTLAALARRHGVKLLMSVGGEAPNADNWLGMARDPGAEARFFDNLEKLKDRNGYAGVDIDWEPGALTDADQATYAAFLSALRARFPGWVISADLGGGDYWARHVSWTAVARAVDFINLMSYDYCGAWSGHSGHAANLYPPSRPAADTGLSVDQQVRLLEGTYGVPAGKLVLGLTFFGEVFHTARLGDPFPAGQADEGTEIPYSQVLPLVRDPGYRALWDKGAQAPYLEARSGDATIPYDDPRSVALKCRYALRKGLAGAMVWNLGADAVDGGTPLMAAVARAFHRPRPEVPEAALRLQLANLRATEAASRRDLEGMISQLEDAGKSGKVAALMPGPEPASPDVARLSPAKLRVQLRVWQDALAGLDVKAQAARALVARLPVVVIRGQALKPRDGALPVDGFEDGALQDALGGSWSVSQDHNGLGTTLLPQPFVPTPGGCPGSPKYCARIHGHYGRNVAPWPYAQLSAGLAPGGGAVDLSAFSAVRFWARGDGKTYDVLLERLAVKDYDNYRSAFTAPVEWTQITLPLSGFKQNAWGRQIPMAWTDVSSLVFSPDGGFSDEDYDLSVDRVEFLAK